MSALENLIREQITPLELFVEILDFFQNGLL